MDKDLIRSAILFAVLMIFFFLISAFINLSFNPVKWGEVSRTMYAMFGSLIALAVAGGYYSIEKD